MSCAVHQQSPSNLLLALVLATACAPSTSSAPAPTAVTHESQVSGTTALLIAVSPVSDSIVWVSGTQGTWLRTLDGGAHWSTGRVSGADTLQFRDVHAFDANTALLLSIGNGDQSRIYRTTDGGASWTPTFINRNPKAFYDCFDFWDSQHGLAVSDGVDGRTPLLETTDGGRNWTPLPDAQLPPTVAPDDGSFAASGTCLVVRPGGQAWIAVGTQTQSRILHSSDYGHTWSSVATPFGGVNSVGFRDDRHGAVTQGGNGNTGASETAITADGGATWKRSAPTPFAGGAWGGVWVRGSRVPTLVAIGPKGAAFTRDDATTWTTIDSLAYWSVGFASPRAGWAVGPRGRITRLGGL